MAKSIGGVIFGLLNDRILFFEQNNGDVWLICIEDGNLFVEVGPTLSETKRKMEVLLAQAGYPIRAVVFVPIESKEAVDILKTKEAKNG